MKNKSVGVALDISGYHWPPMAPPGVPGLDLIGMEKAQAAVTGSK